MFSRERLSAQVYLLKLPWFQKLPPYGSADQGISGRSVLMKSEVSGQRWGMLLGLLLLALLIEPLFGSSKPVQVAGFALFEIVVVSALISSVRDIRGRVFGAILAILWFSGTLLVMFANMFHGPVVVVSMVMLLGALFVTFRNLLDRHTGDLDSLAGAIFGYVLLAATWAALYLQIERWRPGSFTFPDDAGLWSSANYYSLVTLTSLGYGDILPSAPLGRLTAGLEAVVGVLYIAVMIGSIVGSFHRRR